MIFHRKCNSCNNEYEYEGCATLIVFCPHCHRFDYLECEYGYGPIAPCRVYLGNEIVGMITYHQGNQSQYRYDSERYNIHRVLERSYLEALYEAKDITADLL